MSLAVRPQTGPSLVWTVVAVVHDGDAACAAAEVPPTAVTVIPETRAAAAAMNVTARSGRLFPSGDAGLILFHVIVNAPQTGVSLGSPLGRLPVPHDGRGGPRHGQSWPWLSGGRLVSGHICLASSRARLRQPGSIPCSFGALLARSHPAIASAAWPSLTRRRLIPAARAQAPPAASV